jgi:predicted enzyme related to lactoylglutathione lyase
MVDGVAAVWMPVSDMQRAVAFYRDVLGLDVTETDSDWSEVDANGLKLGLNAREKAEQGGGGGAVVSFQPETGIDDEVQRLTQAGVSFTGGISDHEWGRIAPFKDSEGNDLQLYTPPQG